MAWFFRDPRRSPGEPIDAGTMLSPADGRVTAVLSAGEHPATEGPARIVRIFLSVLDVHVNRSPAAAEVIGTEHRPGRYHDARSAISAEENESNLIRLRLTDGRCIGVRQVAGKVARRIVCRLRPGERLEPGQRFGMIRFGSTTELILPDGEGTHVHVEVGDKVRAGRTVLARMSCEL